MKILTIGDIVSENGLKMIKNHLQDLRKKHSIDFVIANGENASDLGITPDQAYDLFSYGVDVITLGNHTFKKHSILSFLDENSYILRPHNFAPQTPGRGYGIFNINNYNVLIVNLLGRVSMEVGADNPFLCVEKILKDNMGEYDFAICDFHASATSEKYALAFHLDGKFSVLFGTHTHVQTNDARVFPKGLGYITDVGMTGPMWSVIGVEPSCSIKMFRGDVQEKFRPAISNGFLNGAIFTINENDFKCESVETITILGD